VRTCGNCGRAVSDDYAFCPACGEALSPAADAGPSARRIVTILFTDMVGSTELGAALDPERFRAVQGRYFDALRIAIERHGGTVEKFIGDAVLAVFGVPRLREDDALRAVRAAGDLEDAIAALNDELGLDASRTIRVRTGVNTGEVVVADAPDGPMASGDPVNVAARLEQNAGPGEILIGAETYRLVRDAVIAERIDGLEVKGKDEPLVAYRVSKVDPAAAGFARRLDAPMVGRERELSLLLDAFDRTVSDHACQLFTVLGVGGVGKSRLLEAFVVALGDRATVLRGRCLPYGDGITFLPVVEAVRQAAGLAGGETPAEVHDRIAALVHDDANRDRIAAQVAQVLGIEGEEVSPEETLWAIRRLLESIASERPLVFLIDDVQWAEPTMLALIEHVADWSVDAPVLLACMARPELLEVRPAWGGGKLNATSISLEPLSDEECAELVANLLAVQSVSDDVRTRVASAAEGHPLFAEEMLAMLIDEGRLAVIDDVWSAVGDLGELAIPPTTSALLAARIDRLDTGDRDTLLAASVIGQVFYPDALRALSDDPEIASRVNSLVRKQFVRPERSDLIGAEALAFRHLLIRDAAYDGLTKTSRAEMHERFAGWLAERAPQQQELIGYHLERACRYLEELGTDPGRVAALAERAAASLRAAGKAAYDRGDMPAAVTLMTRAISLMGPADPALVPVLTDLAMAYAERGELERGEAAATRAVDIARAEGAEAIVARARVLRALIRSWGRPDRDQVQRDVEECLPILTDAGDILGEAFAWTVLGDIAWSASRAAEAEPRWRRAADLFRDAGDRFMYGEELGWLSSVGPWGPMHTDEAIRALGALAKEARGIPVAERDISASMGTVLMMRGDLAGARARIEESDRRLRELGRDLPLAHGSQQIGLLELLSGNAAEADRILGEAVGRLQEMGSDAVGIVSAFRAQALYALGRYDEADRAASEAIKRESYGIAELVIGLGVQGMVAARRGAFDEAEATARRGIAIVDETDFPSDRADARVALAEVLELAGRTEEAVEAAREALALFEAKGNTLQAGHVRERLTRLGEPTPATGS